MRMILKRRRHKMTEVNYDVAIIGAGPTGMTVQFMHHVQI